MRGNDILLEINAGRNYPLQCRIRSYVYTAGLFQKRSDRKGGIFERVLVEDLYPEIRKCTAKLGLVFYRPNTRTPIGSRAHWLPTGAVETPALRPRHPGGVGEPSASARGQEQTESYRNKRRARDGCKSLGTKSYSYGSNRPRPTAPAKAEARHSREFVTQLPSHGHLPPGGKNGMWPIVSADVGGPERKNEKEGDARGQKESRRQAGRFHFATTPSF